MPTKETYPKELPALIALHFKDKGLIEHARKLAAYKDRHGFETYAKAVESMIENIEGKDKENFELKREVQLLKEKNERVTTKLLNLKNSLEALRGL